MLLSAAVGDGTDVAGPPEEVVDDEAIAREDKDVPTEASVMVVVTGNGPDSEAPPPEPELAAAALDVGSWVVVEFELEEPPVAVVGTAAVATLEAKLLICNEGEGTAAGPVPVKDVC